MTKKQQIQQLDDNQPAIPAYLLNKASGLGAEDISSDDVEIPVIKIMQALSPEVVDGLAEPGDFFHTILEENVGTPCYRQHNGKNIKEGSELRISVLKITKEYVLWRPREHDDGGIIDRAPYDPKRKSFFWNNPNQNYQVTLDNKQTVEWSTGDRIDQGLDLAAWGTSDPSDPSSKPAATKTFYLLVHLPDFPELGISMMMFSRSQIKPLKKLAGRIKLNSANGLDIYMPLYNVKTISQTNNDSKTYKNINFSPAGYIEESQIDSMKKLYESVADFQVKDENLDKARDVSDKTNHNDGEDF